MVSGQTEGVWVVSGMGGWMDQCNGWMGGLEEWWMGGLGMGRWVVWVWVDEWVWYGWMDGLGMGGQVGWVWVGLLIYHVMYNNDVGQGGSMCL